MSNVRDGVGSEPEKSALKINVALLQVHAFSGDFVLFHVPACSTDATPDQKFP
ncbi:hypothetical protein ACLOJK_019522, partial [Asimina triloba]